MITPAMQSLSRSQAAKIGLCMLSWRAPETIKKTLSALTLLDSHIFSDRLIFFQEISEADRAVAAQYGMRAVGNNRNLGIREGIKSAVANCQADLVLFLECDCLQLESLAVAEAQISCAAHYIADQRLHVCRLRHTQRPGEDYSGYRKFLRYWPSIQEARQSQRLVCAVRRLLRPWKATRLIGQAVMDSHEAHRRFPQWIEKIECGLMRMNSRVIPWTNQSILVDKSWFLETLLPYAETHPRSQLLNGFPYLEPELNCRWWRRQEFKVGQSLPGIFTHHRLDRPVGDQKTLIHEKVADERQVLLAK